MRTPAIAVHSVGKRLGLAGLDMLFFRGWSCTLILLRLCLIVFLAGFAVLGQQYMISTFAGGGPPPSPVPALNIGIGRPNNVVADAAGNVYFTSMHCLFKLDRNGILSLIAGNARPGYSGDTGPAVYAQLNDPLGLALDSTGNLYIADWGNNRIRKITPGGIITSVGKPFVPFGVAVDSSGNIYVSAPAANRVFKITPDGTQTTFAGMVRATYFHCSGDGGPATSAELYEPSGIALDSAGNLYIADTGNNSIRKVDTRGIITTVVGSCGSGASSILSQPDDVTVDSAGNLYIADTLNNCIRKWGTIVATFGGPHGVAVDSDGNVYVAEQGYCRIRKVSVDGTMSTVAGNGTPGYWGDGGRALDAGLNLPRTVAIDSRGSLYIGDGGNARIRRVPTTGIITTVALAGLSQISPMGMAVDTAGNIYVADGLVVRRIMPDGATLAVAGNGTQGFSGDGGPAVQAQLGYPSGLAVDSAGNLYIADILEHRVRKVSGDGIITTTAGNGGSGSSGDGGPATSAQLVGPWGVSTDGGGSLLIGDGARIRQVAPDGIISTIGGNGAQGLAGAGTAMAVDAVGSIYVGSAGANVLKIYPGGIIARIAGNGMTGYSGDGGPASAGQLNGPESLAIDQSGNVYVADTYNNAVRVLRPLPGPYPIVSAIVNGASNISAPLAPGEIFVLRGSGLGPSQLAQFQLTGNGLIDTSLAKTQVFFNGIPAPMLYTSDQQIAAIVPYVSTGGPVADMVVSYQGHPTNPMPVLLNTSSPALFTADSSGQGQAAAVNQDGSINSADNPAAAGSIISLYATGEGQTVPAGVDGKLGSLPLPKPVLPVTVTIAGQPAPVQYAGGAPDLVAGVMQVNVQIPTSAQPGDAAVVLTVGAASSQPNVTIAVQ